MRKVFLNQLKKILFLLLILFFLIILQQNLNLNSVSYAGQDCGTGGSCKTCTEGTSIGCPGGSLCYSQFGNCPLQCCTVDPGTPTTCTPRTCSYYSSPCGTYLDGCGGTIYCTSGCCTPKTCSGNYPGQCGTFSNGCGSNITCSCTSSQWCDAGTCKPLTSCTRCASSNKYCLATFKTTDAVCSASSVPYPPGSATYSVTCSSCTSASYTGSCPDGQSTKACEPRTCPGNCSNSYKYCAYSSWTSNEEMQCTDTWNIPSSNYGTNCGCTAGTGTHANCPWSACTATTSTTVAANTYNCSGSPSYNCTIDPSGNGLYNGGTSAQNLAACSAACTSPGTTAPPGAACSAPAWCVTAACSSWTPPLVSDPGTCPPGQYCCKNSPTTTIATTTTAPVTYSITGRVFIDNNQNGAYEPTETYTEVIEDSTFNEFSNGDPYLGTNLIKASITGGSVYAIDINNNGVWDVGVNSVGEPFTDLNSNGVWDSGEPFTDILPDGKYTKYVYDGANKIREPTVKDFGTRTSFDYPIYYKDSATGSFIKLNPSLPFVARDYYIDINRDGAITESGIAHEPFTDLNGNGIWDKVIDVPYAGGTGILVQRASSLTTYGNTATNSIGMYGVYGLPSGDYITTLTIPPGYSILNGVPNPASVSLSLLSGNATVNFPLVSSMHTTTGYIFVDNNVNGIKDPGETCYSGGLSVKFTPSGGGADIVKSFTSNAGSCNTYSLVRSDECGVITLTGLATGYKIVALNFKDNRPQYANLTPSTSSSIYVCGSEVNFGVSNFSPWIQTKDADIRMDSGINDPIPANPVCGTSTGSYASLTGAGGTPGIVFSGNSSYNFGQGQASINPYNWIVGGTIYPEVFNTSVSRKTSTAYLLSKAAQLGITPIDISASCGAGGIANCNLSAGLLEGVYVANGNLILNGTSYTFPANKNYIILVKGDLTVNEKILVPNGSTAIFSAYNISVGQTVGESDSTSTASDLEGWYSADSDFTINGINNCGVGDDLRLNIGGNVVVGASGGNGAFQNNRDLCSANTSCPSLYVKARPDFVLNAPSIIKTSSYTWQEVAP